MRYPEESATRENPLRIGTKHIKVNGVEYPFIAISDHLRPSLVHDSRLVWIHHYRAIKGLRPPVFKVYYATVKVPYNRLPWTVDNTCFRERGFESLLDAIETAMAVTENREWLENVNRDTAAVQLGRKGGLIKSKNKTLVARENGKRGGRIGVGSKLILD